MNNNRITLALENNSNQQAVAKLQLTSLMDIFTILVFFIMVNQSDVDILQSDQSLKLPESVSTNSPATNLIISVSSSTISIMGRKIVDLPMPALQENIIPALKEELDYQRNRGEGASLAPTDMPGLPITIMGDKNTDFEVIRKIMATSAAANYTSISLAVEQRDNKIN